MERIEKTVFLSYRRTNIPWAIAIFQNLTQNGYDVFFDYLGIASGDFERIILENITTRAHFLVLLTPSALERCDDPLDWLRREIETALANQRNIVPLMLEGFDFGTPKIASQLTGNLAALKYYNGLSIPSEYFLEAMGKLRGRYLNVPLASVLHPASPFAQQAAAEQKQAAGAAPISPDNHWLATGSAYPDKTARLWDLSAKDPAASPVVTNGSSIFQARSTARRFQSYRGQIRNAKKQLRCIIAAKRSIFSLYLDLKYQTAISMWISRLRSSSTIP
jgi:TIR domain